MFNLLKTLFLLLALSISIAPAHAKDLRQEAQNPVSSVISLPFQNNTFFGIGPQDGTSNLLNIQPVYPAAISRNWNMINRAIVPISYIDKNVPGGSEFGLGDINYTAFFSPSAAGRFIWGLGPTITAPSATDRVLGSEKWTAGPAFVGLFMSPPIVAGALVNHQWSFAGNNNRADVNFTLIQPFVNYNLPKGWYLVSAPIITGNWQAAKGNRWTVPLGGGFGRLFRIGKQPINAQTQAFYHVEKPRGGPDWSLRVQVQFLFPKG